MLKRNFGVCRPLSNRTKLYNRLWQKRRIKRIGIIDIILLILPLIILLIMIPPPKEAAAVKETAKVGPGKENPIKIVVYNPALSVIDEVLLEDYLVGVVAAEMPHSFHEEALKAQAVAARTFAVSRMKRLYGSTAEHYGADICTEPGHCQAWISKERFLEVYGGEKDWEKVQKAVYDTENIVMTYAGELINPLYHANSGGVTEDIDEVWSMLGEVPYLKSVYSPDESLYSQYEKRTVFAWDEIKNKVKNKYPDAVLGNDPKENLEILSWSASGRAEEIRLGSMIISGTDFRELLSLRSTNMEISFPDDKSVEILTRGYGHGVGMSQCGADAMAKKGLKYIEILEHYYTGINVEELTQ